MKQVVKLAFCCATELSRLQQQLFDGLWTELNNWPNRMMDLLLSYYWGAQFCTINKTLFCFFPGWYLSTSCAIVHELFVFTNSRFKTEPIHLILPGSESTRLRGCILGCLKKKSDIEKVMVLNPQMKDNHIQTLFVEHFNLLKNNLEAI